MEVLEKSWASYRDQVIPEDAPEVQLVECRRAFYVGAACVMGVFRAASEEEVTEDEAVALIAGCQQELDVFAVQLEDFVQ